MSNFPSTLVYLATTITLVSVKYETHCHPSVQSNEAAAAHGYFRGQAAQCGGPVWPNRSLQRTLRAAPTRGPVSILDLYFHRGQSLNLSFAELAGIEGLIHQ